MLMSEACITFYNVVLPSISNGRAWTDQNHNVNCQGAYFISFECQGAKRNECQMSGLFGKKNSKTNSIFDVLKKYGEIK